MKLLGVIRGAAEATQKYAKDKTNVDTVRLAVTGLSRAGKTVFMVSLVNNLLALGSGTNSLPRLNKAMLDANGRTRLLGVEIERSWAEAIPRFPYEEYVKAMAGVAPAWPVATEDPAQITLRLKVKRRTLGASFIDSIVGEREIRLELLDYPGEWLLDLPLLEQTFEEWSGETIGLLRESPRNASSAEFLNFIGSVSPNAPADETAAALGFRIYCEALQRCRVDHGLRWLQPGRFMLAGQTPVAPFMQFFPFRTGTTPASGSLAALLRDRFEAYKKHVRQVFFDPYFSRFNRQVVLVDVLGALFAGRTAYEDSRRALERVAASYAKMLEGNFTFGRRIDRVAFVATKSDHVPDLQRDALRATLQEMTVQAQLKLGTRPDCFFHTIASVVCTRDGTHDINGQPTPVVFGVPLGQENERPFSPGLIPSGKVPETYWERPYFTLPLLRPPVIGPGISSGIQQDGLDQVLTDLVGDLL